MDTIKVIKRKKLFLLNSHICNLLKLGVIDGKEWFINNKTHVHNIIWYKVIYLFVFFLCIFYSYMGIKVKKYIYFLFIFFLVAIQTKEKEIPYTLFFSPSLFISKHTKDNWFLFSSFSFSCYYSFLLFCLVFPLFSLVFWRKFLFLTLINANNTSFSTLKFGIFMCQLLIKF